MKLSDYVADFIAKLNSRVYGVCGAGAMHLNDSICHHPGITFTATHHEQAAAYAAEADARVSGQIGIVHVTAGPGVTNAMTGVACAWADSIPMLVIAGQVDSKTMIGETRLRQYGVSEVDGEALMLPITKSSACVASAEDIRFELEYAAYAAMAGRKGPVYLEIPLDVQVADIEPDKLRGYNIPREKLFDISIKVKKLCAMLDKARRPVIIAGNGIRLAGAQDDFIRLVEHAGIPVLSSWNGSDLISTDHALYVGRPGIIGDRAGNFAVQNADLVLAVGTRLSIPQIGHHPKLFAPKAELVVIDIDRAELEKPSLSPALAIHADAGEFLRELLSQYDGKQAWGRWIAQCQEWKRAYPVALPEYRNQNGVNPYTFIDILGKHLADDAIVVIDVGMAFICAMQALRLTGRQRLFHASGIAPMGYGLPAAIGACRAAPGRQIVCLTGDGGIMFNLQELQTIVHHHLPIHIFVFENNGYKTIQTTQNTHFKREAISSPASGLSCPSFTALAEAFNIRCGVASYPGDAEVLTRASLELPRTTLSVIELPDEAVLAPRVQSRLVDGKFVPVSIDNMWPYLDTVHFIHNDRISA